MEKKRRVRPQSKLVGGSTQRVVPSFNEYVDYQYLSTFNEIKLADKS